MVLIAGFYMSLAVVLCFVVPFIIFSFKFFGVHMGM